MTDNASIFQGINWDEGSDNPFGLEPGIYETTISEAKIERSEKGNLGLWLTFTDDNKKSIRKWTTMPEPDQDKETYARNTSFLRMLLRSLEIPEGKWGDLEPADFETLDCTIVVNPQKKNPEYNQISKITRTALNKQSSVAFSNSGSTAVPEDGGFKF